MGIWLLCRGTKRKACGFPAGADYFFQTAPPPLCMASQIFGASHGNQKRSPCAVSKPQISSRLTLVTHPISVRTVGLAHSRCGIDRNAIFSARVLTLLSR